ncbi:radical SAM protein [Vibrio cholerae]|uniref:radical SAM protein n=1 Tax=Vibrio cholerae TaxID=666 RepID=UPI0011D5C872|nr:radical SAM protein [Vibrio cholerae]EGR2425121.1 radical SAM protein [Vibrio cholerae]EGR4157844.1 radical SAM protein [Vibrio cholerae]EJB8348576.1 radical SAM protein [Vibrio cholerae]EJB8378857.1 radical SAM protein [Vibrio cholerae]EJL6483669.1 radical SAM protein [Vibrio cholerae]
MALRNSMEPFIYPHDYPKKWVRFAKFWFQLKALWRWFRVQKPVTRLMGYQYQAADDLLEIDITYQCNLKCNNCNRSSAQAPDKIHIGLEEISQFVEDSLCQHRSWRKIRILGGEPTLHPELNEILSELHRLKIAQPDLCIQLVTNGYGRRVNTVISKLPDWLSIENSAKTDSIQPDFGPFNLAPVDSWYHKFSDYSNGCDIARTCGLGLTPQGYYPCAVGGGIDRVLNQKNGRQRLPSGDDEMRDLMKSTCGLCGRFRNGHYVPPKLRPKILVQQTSMTWKKIYRDWKSGRHQ